MISFHFLSFILFHYLFTILHLFPFFSILFSISVPPCSQSIARPPSRHSFFVHFLLSDAHFFRFDARLALLLTQRHTDRQSSLTVHLHSGTSHVLSGLFRNGRRSLPLDVAPRPPIIKTATNQTQADQIRNLISLFLASFLFELPLFFQPTLFWFPSHPFSIGGRELYF